MSLKKEIEKLRKAGDKGFERTFIIGPASSKPWRYITDLEKLFYYHAAILTDPTMIAAHVSINFSPKRELAETLNSTSIRTVYQKVLRSVFKSTPILDYINIVSMRKPGSGKLDRKLHIHGLIGIPREVFSEELLETLEKELTKSPLCRKWTNDGHSNKAVDVALNYKNRVEDLRLPNDFGWIRYQLQHHRLFSIKRDSKKKKFETLKSLNLIKAAKELYKRAQKGKLTLTQTLPGSFPEYEEMHRGIMT